MGQRAARSPKRNLSDACAIAEVISRFDVCAVQETRRNLTALQTVMRILGPDWAYVVTDVTEGGPGNGERLCLIHDRGAPARRARRGDRGAGSTDGVVVGALDRQFARTPYAVSFAAGQKAFTLVTLHATYAASKADKDASESSRRSPRGWPTGRRPSRLRPQPDRARRFNITAKMTRSTRHLRRPAPRPTVSTTSRVTSPMTNGGPNRHYHQIAWFMRGHSEAWTLSDVMGCDL